eukprot:CAMPEP_0185603200 /NCGR_PEP_ID=MMETSP0436-20130131/2255_1 /TAXON_ID=626734 ORGANISM="Favella taraikaensis, Strain Fe Narragansett Bay" /NCGR_SAMPLE_ID=MMETSP0436 /ASSEMBLY_ACC=CAM_ASM_000390 /LENGTH=52 /DNA_ID=CAMNT_0028233563 /DNA_START=61 /DNA_END=219 /DNA_ORIENTATION=-
MASDIDGDGVLAFSEVRTLYKLLCNQQSGDASQQLQEIRYLFNEYAEVHMNV